MRRREFIALISGAAATWPVLGHADQEVMPVVGVLCAGTAEALERYLASFQQGMRQLGYVEGSNIRFELRFADGYLDRLPDLANELVRLNPSVIVSTPLPSHLAARKATSTIPIVMATGADPVGFGSHYAARVHYPRHLSNAFSRIGDKENHQCHYGRIKRTSRERECHGVPALELCQTRGGPLARKVELGLRRVNAIN